MAVADAGGLASLTIRSLAQELGVKPMSVYYHVANKEEILDGIVDLVFSEIDLPTVGGDWRDEMTPPRALGPRGAAAAPVGDRCSSSHGPSPGPATLRHHDAVLGTLRAGRLLGGDDGARVRPARRLRVRIRAAGGVPAVRGSGRRGGDRRADHGS